MKYHYQHYQPIPVHDTSNVNAMNHKEKWLEWRKEGIGGSDSAAARGKGKYKTTLELFWEKTSDFQREPENWETLLFGQLIEPYARRMFSWMTGFPVKESHFMYQHPQHKFMLASLDGIVLLPNGEKAILECKAVHPRTAKAYGTDTKPKIPYQYDAQMRHCMAVMNVNTAYLIAIYGNTRNDVIIRKVTRDHQYENVMIKELKQFWNKVECRQEPDVFEDQDPDLILKALQVRKYVDGTIELPYEKYRTLLEQYYNHMDERQEKQQELKEIEKSLQYIKSFLINALKGVDGNYYDRGIIVDGQREIEISYQKKPPHFKFGSEEAERLLAKYPEIYQEFCALKEENPRFSIKVRRKKRFGRN